MTTEPMLPAAMLPSPDRPLKIGTRGSPLALWQAHEVRRCLMAAHDLPEAAFETVVIKVTGDQIQDKALREIGGKGLFTREIEDALLAGGIDIAVHSMKDMPTLQPEGLILDCYLARADVREPLSRRNMPRSGICRRGRRSAPPACAAAHSWRWCALICGWSSFAAMCRPVCASCKRGWRMQPSSRWPG